jgi:hypothetical protein
LDVVFGSPTADAEIGIPNLNLEKTRFGRNRNLKIPARGQDEQSVLKNQERASPQPENAVAKGAIGE